MKMPIGQPDHYAVLGVNRDASPEAIKRAYHAAARRFHPDRNLRPGETELFLDVQRAYEVLSDPQRRAEYDITLPIAPAPPLVVTVQYSRSKLARLAESQILYALVEVSLPESGPGVGEAPLGVCLVIDRSTSMQGVKLDLAKAGAIRIMEMLPSQAAFGVIAFGDRAEVLVPFGYGRDARQARSHIQAIQAGGGTEILRGLEAAMVELRRGIHPDRADHLVLVTDGHTYGDEEASLRLADEAAGLNISIHGFGIGGDWNDTFMDALAGRTGGNSTFVSQPQDIESVLVDKLDGITHNSIDDARLTTAVQGGVRLSYAFRLQPETGPIEIRDELHLGPVRRETPLRVLFEFTIEPLASRSGEVALLDGMLGAVIRGRGAPLPPMGLRMRRLVATVQTEETPPRSMMDALSKVTLYRLQERARTEAEGGEYASATRHLRYLAARFEARGLHDLAQTALLEAESVEKGGPMSREGGKGIKYGTKALLPPPLEQPT